MRDKTQTHQIKHSFHTRTETYSTLHFNETYCSGFYRISLYAIVTLAPLLTGWLVVHIGAECDIGQAGLEGSRYQGCRHQWSMDSSRGAPQWHSSTHQALAPENYFTNLFKSM